MKPVTYLNRARLSDEQKAEILRDGEHGFWGAADTFAGLGRNKEKKQMGFTFAHK